MVSITVIRLGRGIPKLVSNLRNTLPLNRQLAKRGYEAVMENFRAEGRNKQGSGKQWKELSPYTVARRARILGPTRAAHPILVFTGAMKNSVRYQAKKDRAVVSVSDFKAKFHVFGTFRIPQRNFMMLTNPDIAAMLGDVKEYILKGIGGR